MKKHRITILSLALLIGFAFSQNVYATEPSQVAADHLKMEKYYAGKAVEQDAIIAEHQQMKSEYKQQYFINEKVTPVSRLKEMEKHCDAIIHDTEKLKSDYLETEKWHKMRAAELQGK
ncbi:MAG TPA: hypothetical protein VEM40_06770 [Nitrospirota bacterium]|nr:hypothetical protein [Nitrospirota bacterium]